MQANIQNKFHLSHSIICHFFVNVMGRVVEQKGGKVLHRRTEEVKKCNFPRKALSEWPLIYLNSLNIRSEIRRRFLSHILRYRFYFINNRHHRKHFFLLFLISKFHECVDGDLDTLPSR